MKRKHIMEIGFLAFSIIGLILFTHWGNKIEKKRFQDSKFAIGTFQGSGYSYKAGGDNYKYSYYNEDEGRVLNKTDQVRMNNQPRTLKPGDQFLVLYNKDGSGMYFDRPIKDSSDFKWYVQEFEEMRKQKK